MQQIWRRGAHAWPAYLLAAAGALVTGCASPGPPHPPSLQIPRAVSDLAAMRSGDVVELKFTVPNRTTDDLPLRETAVSASLCRQVGSGPCVPVDAEETRAPLPVPAENASPVRWIDHLPADLQAGKPRLLAYRVELRSTRGRTAGYSDAAYAAAGTAPPPIAGLVATGTRLGVELQWAALPGAGEVVLRRSAPVAEAPAAAPAHGKAQHARHELFRESSQKSTEPGVVWLQAAPGDASAAATVDGSVKEGVPYTYVAQRRETVQVGGRALDLRSAESGPVTVTWRDVYPPVTPHGLTALGFVSGAGAYAVDLVWEPVNDLRLTGYLVYRQALNAAGEPEGARVKLTPQPVPAPGFHDATAQAGVRYRYSVTAVDPKGNESGADLAVVEGSAGQ